MTKEHQELTRGNYLDNEMKAAPLCKLGTQNTNFIGQMWD